MARPDSTGGKQGRFVRGTSGNPAGRPRGQRHRYLNALDQVGLESAAAIVVTLSQRALAGDVAAAALILSRAWPAPKGRVMNLALPPVESAADVPRLLGLVVGAVARGEVTGDEGASLATLLTACLRSFETIDFEDRLARLEAAS